MVIKFPTAAKLTGALAQLCSKRGDAMRDNARKIYQKNYAGDFAAEIANLLGGQT